MLAGDSFSFGMSSGPRAGDGLKNVVLCQYIVLPGTIKGRGGWFPRKVPIQVTHNPLCGLLQNFPGVCRRRIIILESCRWQQCPYYSQWDYRDIPLCNNPVRKGQETAPACLAIPYEGRKYLTDIAPV